jgi:hypothetical protein
MPYSLNSFVMFRLGLCKLIFSFASYLTTNKKFKEKMRERAGGMVQVGQCLSTKFKALNSNPRSTSFLSVFDLCEHYPTHS